MLKNVRIVTKKSTKYDDESRKYSGDKLIITGDSNKVRNLSGNILNAKENLLFSQKSANLPKTSCKQESINNVGGGDSDIGPNTTTCHISKRSNGLTKSEHIAAPAVMWKRERMTGSHGRTKRIYTDWANHYLEKSKAKKQIQDLQVDVTDGVVLADVIEAVTTQRVPEIHRKPKTASQMLDNIQSCLVFLSNLGVVLEGINARDIRDGHLKSILSLFFQLSRYKQQQKQQDRDRHSNQRQPQQTHSHLLHQTIPDNSIIMMQQQQQQHHHHHPGGGGLNSNKSSNNKHAVESSKLPSPYCKQHTSIPLPAGGSGSDNRLVVPGSVGSSTSLVAPGVPHHHSFPQSGNGGHHLLQHHHGLINSGKKTGIALDKGKGGHPYNSSGSLNGVKPTSGNSSRSTSPSSAGVAAGNSASGIPHSFIPQPRGSSSIPSAPSSARSSIHEKHLPSSAKLPSGPIPTISPTASKNSTRTQNNNAVNIQQHGSNQQINLQSQSAGKGGNSSMLEKFKFFKDKDKSEKLKGSGASTSSCGSNKRTSSSSGFSSARSERSDSSVSLSSESKGVPETPSSSSSSGVILRNRSTPGDRVDSVGRQSQNQMVVDSTSSSTPRLAIKGFRQKLGKAIAVSKQESPQKHYSSSSSSPKSGRKEESQQHSLHPQYSNGSTQKSGGSAQSSRSKSRTMTKSSQQSTDSPSSSSGNLAVENVSSGSQPASFLRQPKSTGGNSRDSKNRVSSSGIPTRNSLIVKDTHQELTNHVNNNAGSNLNNNLTENNSVSTTSLNSTSSATNTTNGVLQSLGNGTGIPKPTAAVKGTTKQSTKQQLSPIPSGENSSKLNTSSKSGENGEEGDPREISKPEVTSCSSSESRSNLSQTSFSSEKSALNKTSTSSSLKSNDTTPSTSGITVALVSPMPSLSNSVSNTASMSSIESASALTQSQFSASSVSQSNSNSNSSDATVMLASKYHQQQQQQLQQQSSTDDILTSLEESAEQVEENKAKLDMDSPPSQNKISPGSEFASYTASGSSSMGSLSKCGVEMGSSSSGASLTSPTAPEDDANPTVETNGEMATDKGKSTEENNGNSVISECDEDDLLINVKPMEPLLRNSPYGYIKSPPGTHPSGSSQAFFQAQKGIQMRRTGSCENGNQPTTNRALVKSVGSRQGYPTGNPYCDPRAVRRAPQPPGSFSTSGYSSSTAGDYDYADIDNFDMNAAGYLSDGDLLGSGADSNRLNDGYVSESGVSIYGRRVNHQNQNGGTSRQPASSNRSGSHNGSTSKHAVITEDSFDDSSSISSGISDLNEIPTDLTSSSVNSEVSSPYDSLQRGSSVSGTNICGGSSSSAKALNSLSKPSAKKLEPSQQSIIYRVVGSRSSSRRSTGADTSDLNTNTRTSTNPSFPPKLSNLPYSPHQNRSATLPVGFVDPSRIISGKGAHKHGHLVSNLRSSESSSSLRRVASPVQSSQHLVSPSGGVVVLAGGDYGTPGIGANCRVVTRSGETHHYSTTNGQAISPSSRSGTEYCIGNGSNGVHKRSMNNLDPKNANGRKGMMGIKEDHYVGAKETQRGSGSSGSSSSSGGLCETGKRSKNIGVSSPGGAPGAGFGFMRARPVAVGAGNGNGKYAVPVTTVVGNGKIIGVRGDQGMMTAEEFKQAHAALAVASASSGHISPYSVITTIQQQHQHPHGPQSPKTRTKVKVSGGTQTTNDLHEMSGRAAHGMYSQHHGQTMHHHHHHPSHHSQTLPGHVSNNHPHHSEGEYASSTCSRNSGSFAPSTSSQGVGSSSGYKSLSLTTPTAAQLSQSLRERILGSQSLPKGATSSADYAAILAAIQQQHQHHHNQQIYGTPNSSRDRMSRYAAAAAAAAAGNGSNGTKNLMNDGSLSDAGGYVAYNEIYASMGGNNGGSGNTPYSWMRHSTGYASSITSAPTRLAGAGGSMTEAESMESLSSTSSLAAQLRDARSNSLTQGRIQSAQQSREQGSPSRSPRLNRSNSIRSTKSEKLYPSMLQRNDDGNPYYSSTMSASGVPTSPIHGPTARICSASGSNAGPYSSAASASSNHSVRLSMSPYSGFLAKLSAKEDEINASSLSLVSTASSLYSSQEDKHAHEVRKLRRELAEAQEKVQTLTNQLTTNAHVVAAFEQSLSNMTQRLQTLTLTAEQKDSELTELRNTIDHLRKQSVEAGLTVAQMACEESPMARQLSADSVSSINSISSACSGASHSHTSSPSAQVQMTPSGTPTHSANLTTPESPGSKKKHVKGKGWLRSSFTKAFSRGKTKSRNDSSPDHGDMFMEQDSVSSISNYSTQPSFGQHHQGSLHHRTIPSQHPHQQQSHHYHQNGGVKAIGNSMPTSPLLSPPTGDGRKNSPSCSVSTGSHSPRSNGGATVSHDGRSRQGSSSGLSEDHIVEEPKSVDELKKQLREKEMVLTDIRLEALTSAHQLESLKETVTKMRNEMLSLKQDNERLQRIVTCKSLTSSQTSLQMISTDGADRRLSASEVPPPSSTTLEMFLTGDVTEKEGKRIIVTVYLGSHGSYERYISPVEGLPAQECIIGTINVNNKTKWDALDTLVKRAFKDYLMRIDPMSSLGLNADSVLSYAVGEVLRTKEGTPPELLPCGYLVGDVTKIRVCLKGALMGSMDALAFETLVPKSVLQRCMSLIGDNNRIIICGPSGTGKSYLARKLGEYIVARSGKDPCPEAIASFSADHKNSKELRQYLTNLVEQCDVAAGIDLPSVIILDNLHQVQNLGDVFNGVLLNSTGKQQQSLEHSTSPIIIGTMTQSASAPPTGVHHNFRWVAFSNHTEPVKGLLSRYLQRRLIEVDTQNGTKNLELARIIDWIPKVWHHINKFLEAHNSVDVTIGPRLLLSCPMDVANSQVWFTDLWHYSVVPYLTEATKEGIQLYGKKAMWEDPSQYLTLTYPWSQQVALNTGKSSLQRIRPEDVGYDTKSGGPVGVNGGSKMGSNGVCSDGTGDSDPLMNMLMRLQEAANYSGPQSNDSDSTSLDSHVSLDPKDFIATAN